MIDQRMCPVSTMSGKSTELIPSSINIIKIHIYYLFADQAQLCFLSGSVQSTVVFLLSSPA